MKKANEPIIYYKIVGSDKIHSITPVNYNFLKKRVFDKEGLDDRAYHIKDSISYIYFNKCFGEDYSYAPIHLFGSSNTKISITLDSEKDHYLKIYGKDITIKTYQEETIKFIATIKGSKGVDYKENRKFVISEAEQTILFGNSNCLDLLIDSTYLEINNATEYISLLKHSGNKIVLNNFDSIITEFETDADEIDIKDSNIKSFSCNFKNCVRPIFIDSKWKVLNPLDYNGTTIGHDENGIIITDKTFSNKESLELENKDDLKEVTDGKIDFKTEIIDEIESGYQKRRVKTIMQSNNN